MENKGIIIKVGILSLVAVLLGISWYFMYYIKTPEYSIGIIKAAVQQHDVDSFKEHVDLEAILNKVYEDMFYVELLEERKERGGTSFKDNEQDEFERVVKGMSVITCVEPVQKAYDKILNIVSNNSKNDGSYVRKDVLEDLDEDFGLHQLSMLDIVSSSTDGDEAIISIKAHQTEMEEDFIFDVKMKKKDNGAWKVVEILNTREYYTLLKEKIAAKKRNDKNEGISDKTKNDTEIQSSNTYNKENGDKKDTNKESASITHSQGYMIEFSKADGRNQLQVDYHKPSGVENYVIEFYSGYFIVRDCWGNSDRNEIGLKQYYENNSGTNAVKDSAISKGWLSL